MLPTITDGSGALTMAQAILADPVTPWSARGQHRQPRRCYRGFDGIDLDYEGFAFSDGRASWRVTTPVWNAFIYELAAKLHANGRLLSVTMPPMWIAGGVVTGYTVYARRRWACTRTASG